MVVAQANCHWPPSYSLLWKGCKVLLWPTLTMMLCGNRLEQAVKVRFALFIQRRAGFIHVNSRAGLTSRARARRCRCCSPTLSIRDQRSVSSRRGSQLFQTHFGQ